MRRESVWSPKLRCLGGRRERQRRRFEDVTGADSSNFPDVVRRFRGRSQQVVRRCHFERDEKHVRLALGGARRFRRLLVRGRRRIEAKVRRERQDQDVSSEQRRMEAQGQTRSIRDEFKRMAGVLTGVDGVENRAEALKTAWNVPDPK